MRQIKFMLAGIAFLLIGIFFIVGELSKRIGGYGLFWFLGIVAGVIGVIVLFVSKYFDDDDKK